MRGAALRGFTAFKKIVLSEDSEIALPLFRIFQNVVFAEICRPLFATNHFIKTLF